LKGVGKWMAIRGEAIYGSGASPFRQLDFGYATTKPGRLFLFVKQMPESGELFLPGAMGTLESAVVMGDPKAEALTITMGGKGAAISTSTMSAALERVRVKFGESAMTMPVVEVMVKGALKVRPETIGAGADGGVVLDAKSADHFMNYNGEGYEAPNTLYKLRWFVAPKPGMYRVAMQYRAKAAGAAVVEVDGRAMPVRIAAGEQSVVVGTRVLIDGDWSSVEVTPAQPFYKGTVLGLDLVGIRLTPVD
jgi:alpha-L-fucosidase